MYSFAPVESYAGALTVQKQPYNVQVKVPESDLTEKEC